MRGVSVGQSKRETAKMFIVAALNKILAEK